MFSPQPHSGDIPLNPAARSRRPRPSRPTSRVQQRHERSASGLSVAGSTKEDSVILLRQDSESVTNASADVSLIRKQSTGLGGKEQDGSSTDLTKNEKYRVSKLPGLPKILSESASNNIRVTASTDSAHRYALLLSHDCAYVWEYTVPHALPLTFSFPLPREGPADANAPFPLGALVSPSANSQEPGLVVIMPMTGRIAYWDAVGSAVSEGLFAKRRGVEGKVPTMSNEIITSVCNAEPAGFIISTSSGRLAHLALRDAAGRPGVTVTIMRGTTGLGGLLGALRAGSNRRDIAAVRSGKSLRMGEREVLVCTERGIFSRWHINRSGNYANTTDVDLRVQIQTALSGEKALQGKNIDGLHVIDFQVASYVDSGIPGQEDAVRLLVLTGMMSTNNHSATYALVSLDVLASGSSIVGSVHVIKSYATGWETSTSPKLYFPSPKKTVFVVFGKAVVVISGLTRERGMDGEDQGAFEDVIDFRSDLHIEIVGSGSEGVGDDLVGGEASFTSDQGHIRRIKNPGVVLVAKGAGILRVEAFDIGHATVTAPVTVKSKLEQAVFFGTKRDNPLNFSGRREVKFPVEELEEAALEVSREILCSRSPYMPTMLPSLGSHLEMRSTHLRNLMTHLKTGAFGRVSKGVRWRLLQDAEKCEAAGALWDVRNERLREDPTEADGVLEAVIAAEFPPDDTDVAASNDPTRAWFQRGVQDIGRLLHSVKKGYASLPNQGKQNRLAFAIADCEANDLVLGALKKAWEFRAESATSYGLAGENGVGKNGFLRVSKGYMAPWTSETSLLEALAQQYLVSEAILRTFLGPSDDVKRNEVFQTMVLQLVLLAETTCKAFLERATWGEQQIGVAGEEFVEEAKYVRERYEATRGEWIKPLVTYGELDSAYRIAEDYEDFKTLVEICYGELKKNEIAIKEATTKQEDSEPFTEEIEAISDRLESYFQRFGGDFAMPLYEYLVENNMLYTLLGDFDGWRERYLTPFLRKDPKYAKVSWIHDVGLGDYETAANTLLSVAAQKEGLLLNQQIQLSIGKLAKLAALENRGATEDDVEEELDQYDTKLELIKIQQKLYAIVKDITHSAIDVDAAVQLGTDEYGRKVRKSPATKEVFRHAFRELVSGKVLKVEDLVELLTIMEPTDGPLMEGESFGMALNALGLAGLPKAQRQFVEATIWRRCYLRDDWTHIISTRGRTDEDVTELSRQTSVFTTLVYCYQNGLFESRSPFQPLSPEACLWSENTDEIRARFPGATEEELLAFAHDLSEENRRLKRHMAKGDMQAWFHGMDAQAQEETRRMNDEEDEEEDADGDVTME